MKPTYDDVSPVTGNYKVLITNVDEDNASDNYCLCMDSGYHTYEKSWKEENEFVLKSVEKSYPKELIEKKVVDSRGSVWYPMFGQMPGVVLTPFLDDHGDIEWQVRYAEPASKEEVSNPDNIISIVPVTVDGQRRTIYQKLTETVLKVPMLEFEKAYDKYMEIIDEIMKKYSGND